MKFLITGGLAASALLASAPALAQDRERPESSPAIGADIFLSSDSDDTQILRIGADFDLRNSGPDRYLGIRLEGARYEPAGSETVTRERVFLRAADTIGNWQWRARIGTDGDNVIGSFSINDIARIRKEFFVERDVIETRRGLDEGLYTTFIGAAVDLPVNDRNTLTALGAVQTFSGDNVRLHLRGSYIHTLVPSWGLSAQLRGRYFSNSEPREFDYYSPRWYAEVLPVLQVRRFVGGWELVGAAGLGLQRDADSDWRQSRFAQARVRSPLRRNWSVEGAVTYTNQPSITGATGDSGYSYVQFSFGVSMRF